MSKSLALALVLVFLTMMTLVVVSFQPVNAQVERVTTYCAIFVDNIVEGQPVTATIQMSPATPTGEGYTQLIIYLKSPNGVGASSPNGPWVYTNISTDTNGKATVTFDVPTYSGKWYVTVDFGSHSYANYSMLYLAGTWQAGFTVSPIKTPTPSTTATPTASPIPTDNRTPTPTVPEFPSWTIPFLLIIAVAAAGLLVYHKTQTKSVKKSRLGLVNKPIQEGFFTKHNTFRFEMKPHKLLGLLIVGVFLASTVTAAAQMYPKALNPTVNGETTIYEFNGNPINLTAAIDSLEVQNKQAEVAFTLTLMSPTFDLRGEEMNASQYHKPEKTLALQYYLRSALTFDLDRNFTINAVWVNWLAGSGKDIENGYTTLDEYSHYFSLNQSGDSFHGNAVLPKLSEGVHNVTFWVTARQNYISYFIPLWAVFSKTVTFTVDTTAPTVTVMSPANQTYATDGVPLDFFVNESSPRMSYSLDGMENVTVSGNTTLTELPNGVHNIIIYAEDAFGNVGASETVAFTVAKPDTSLTALVIIITAAVVTGAGSLLYFKKRRLKSGGKP